MRDMPPLDHIREALSYDLETGLLTWKNRPLFHFQDSRAMKIWNTRYAGKKAGKLLKSGYIQLRIDRLSYRSHHIAWVLCGQTLSDNLEIDHKNRIRNDNRFSNLRECTRSQNNCNSRTRSTNRLGIKGVHFEKHTGKFRAEIALNHKSKHLGRFLTAEEAHAAYCAAADEIHGTFSNHGTTERQTI